MSDANLSVDASLAQRGRRERRPQARPGELLQAALALFAERGFAATRVEAIARRAGVSKGTLFLYFPSKHDLFKAVIREHIGDHIRQWTAELEAFEGTTEALLRYALQAWWQRVGSTPVARVARLIALEAGNFPDLAEFYHREVVLPGNALIRRILLRGIERGEFRPVDPEQAVYLVVAPMLFLMGWAEGPAPWTACRQGLDPAAFLELSIDNLLRGLRAV